LKQTWMRSDVWWISSDAQTNNGDLSRSRRFNQAQLRHSMVQRAQNCEAALLWLPSD
jgi:hypothetical protein